MPKVKDLGINVVPAGMRPPEIGGGGGGGWCLGTCGHTMRFETDEACSCITGGDCGCNLPSCAFTQDVMAIQTQPTDPACQCLTARPECTPTVQCPGGSQCTAGSHTTAITPHTPQLAAGVLTRDDIAALRTQIREYMDNLDVAEKALLPKTIEDIDAREKALQAELDQLKAHRSQLKK